MRYPKKYEARRWTSALIVVLSPVPPGPDQTYRRIYLQDYALSCERQATSSRSDATIFDPVRAAKVIDTPILGLESRRQIVDERSAITLFEIAVSWHAAKEKNAHAPAA